VAAPAAPKEGGNKTPESAAFPFMETLSPRAWESLLVRAARKSLEHKQILAFEGRECASLPLVLAGALRVCKVSESGKGLTLYRIERGESCVLTATCILNRTRFPAVAEAEGRTEVLLLPARCSPGWSKKTGVGAASCSASIPGVSR
jgi:CRP/FNR family transcriptional regulator